MFISAFIVGLVALFSGSLVATPDRNGFDQDALMKAAHRIQATPVTTSWTKFYFTNTGSYAFPQFTLNCSIGCSLVLVDYYCSGDRFRVWTTRVGSTNGTTPIFPPSCNTYAADPDTAFPDSNHFSRVSITFPLGFNGNITIVALSSPYSAGAGAIRFQAP